MIIKKFMGSGDNEKKTNIAKIKDCGICQEAFVPGKDDFRINHCAACIETDRVRHPDMWTLHFAQKRANTLSPDMELLLEKLADKREADMMLGGSTISRGTGTGSEGPRSFTEIRQKQANFAASLETVRGQVMEHLPTIIAELGLANKIDAELMADMIVPAKIHIPIQDVMTVRAILRDIVIGELGRLNIPVASDGIKIKGIAEAVPVSDPLAHAGIQRLGSTSNISRQVKAAPMMAPPQMLQMPPNPMEGVAPNPLGSPLQPSDPADFGGMSMGDPSGALGEQALGMNDPSMPRETVGDVVRLSPEEEAEISAQDMMQPPEMQPPGAALDGSIMPNDPNAYGPPQAAPMGDPSAMAGMDGGISRVQQAAASRVRVLKPQIVTAAQPTTLNLMTVTGRIAKNVPVQSIKLDVKARQLLNNTPPANSVVAAYSDGSTTTFDYHLTDNGAIFTSAKSEFYAETPQHFTAFLSGDPTFVKWAFIPEDLMTFDPMEPIQADPALMQLPGQAPMPQLPPGPLQAPGINGITPTVLSPSQDNVLESPGLMNDQDAIFNNQYADNSVNDMVADEAASMLPGIQQQNPGLPEEQHMNMAVAAATTLLMGLFQSAALEHARLPNEEYGQHLQRMRTQYPELLREYTKHIQNNPQQQNDLDSWMRNYGTQPEAEGVTKSRGTGVGRDALNVALPGPAEEHGTVSGWLPEHESDTLNKQVPQQPGGRAIVDERGIATPVDKVRNQEFEQARQHYTPPASIADVVPFKPESANASNVDPMGAEPPDLMSPRFDPPVPTTRGPKKLSPSPVLASQAIIDILETTADMSEDDFVRVAMPILIEAGYTDEEIMMAYAAPYDADPDEWREPSATKPDHPDFNEKSAAMGAPPAAKPILKPPAGPAKPTADPAFAANFEKNLREHLHKPTLQRTAGGDDAVFVDNAAVQKHGPHFEEMTEDDKRGLHNAHT